MSFIYGEMDKQYIEVDYPCWSWYILLAWNYVFIPLVVVPIGLWIMQSFSVINWLGLVLILQILWLRRIMKDIWVPFAVLVERERVVVYTRIGKRIRETTIAIKDLKTEYDVRKNSKPSLSLWQSEENRYPLRIFYLIKDLNWTKDKIEELKNALAKVSHYQVHYKEY